MTTDIRHLLDKYFEGDTSAEEEKRLRHYFAQGDLPHDLKIYTSIFRFLDDESTALAVINEIQNDISIPRRPSLIRKLRTIAAIAATLLIAILLLKQPDKQTSFLEENYVWVDGKQITDPATVSKYAESSFGKVQPENDIIKDQLRFMLE